MKFSKKLKSILFFALVLIVLLSSVVFADNETPITKADNEAGIMLVDENLEATSNVVSKTLYLANSSVTIDYPVEGNVFVMAQDLTISGNISGNVFALAQNLKIETTGSINSTLFVCAENVTIDGTVSDVFSISSNLTINNNARITQDITAGGSTLKLGGTIGRNANFGFDEIYVSDSAMILGNLSYSSRVAAISEDIVSGIQTFRAYGVGGLKNKTVINAMREFCRISFVYESKVLPIGAVFGILSWLSCPLVILLAYAPWVAGTLNTVEYLLICMLPLFCAKLANSIFVDLTSYKNLMISKNKISGVMNEPEETGSMKPLHTATHEITFDSVDFEYVPGEPVLKHATFTVPDQKLTAIVGDSGSGKSTILNLIAKYYEATGGTISIGGKPINHVAAERVLEQVSMVDQDVFLFDDTIRDNIRHARPNATDTEIEDACREANCDSFIRKMEKGYDTPTGENGNLLSGGERQRISIARAILKNSPILLLDEATASLDIENELAVKQAIANLLKEKKTVVMIAHTLSIVKNADQILVMGDGRIAESGTHEELLAKGGKYAAMWNAEQKISA